MGGLTIVGLGPAGPELLTCEADQVLRDAPEIYFRTFRHPTLAGLKLNASLESFDHLYDLAGTLDEVYAEIADRLVVLAQRPRGVVYAVPGHPLVGERSVRLLVERARSESLPLRIVAGLSFLEPTLTLIGLDPIADGLQILDAATLVGTHFGGGEGRDAFAARARLLDPYLPSLVTQIDSSRVASSLKLALLEWLPADYGVVLVHGAGLSGARVETLPVFELDRVDVDHLTSMYIPPVPPLSDLASFETLRYLTMRLRAEGGCPWDREQTHGSLKPNLIEEAYEAVEAIERATSSGDWEELTEELGDLLMNLLLHSQIAAEDGRFWLEDVLRGINAKLVRRHPHVFGDVVVGDAADVVRNWDRIKKSEKDGRANATRLGEVPVSLPALARAQTLGRRARRTGFEWIGTEDVWRKLAEELDELRVAADQRHRTEEVGDVLWMVATLAGYLNIDAEEALRETTRKFARRFAEMEQLAAERGEDFAVLTLEQQIGLWQQVKDAESP